jgi:3-hydroxybutyrate dehydrogenase
VMICDIAEPQSCEELRTELSNIHGVEIAYCQADLSEPARIKSMIAQTLDKFRSVEILVNNAVVRHFAPLETFPLEEWNRALAVNVTAAFIATQCLLPVMRAEGYGRIFNMTSVYGSRGTVNRVDYVTTKTALQGLTRATALELAGSPVSCHALTPGTVQTPSIQVRIDELMVRDGLSREQAEERFLAGKQPNGRFVDAESVVRLMLFLCGPTGLDMNGAILPIEGGWLARS